MLFADLDALSKLSAWGLYDEACRMLGTVPADVRVVRSFAPQLRGDRHGRWSTRLTAAGRLRALRAADAGRDDFPIREADADLLLSLEQRADTFRVDEGERALIAGVLYHEGSLLTTGDKNALRALTGERACSDICRRLDGRVIHLEQVVLRLIDGQGFEAVRERIVPVRSCDRAIAAAFGSGMAATEANVRTYLAQSVDELRRDTGGLLAAD